MTASIARTSSLRLLALYLLVQAASPQSTLRTHDGDSVGDHMQVSAGGRDLDGDGIADYLVAAPDDGGDRGIVHAYSGNTGTTLWVRTGSKGDRLGHDLALIDDMSGDGIPDVVAGSPGAALLVGNEPGKVSVLSGATGATVMERWGTDDGAEMGYCVASGFDWNLDGVEDFAGGAPSYSEFFIDGGNFRVWSGADGSLLWHEHGGGAALYLGFSLAGVGDVDGDGFGDLAVGIPGGDVGATDTGSVLVYAGFGVQLLVLNGLLASGEFGYSIAPADDRDLDGHADFLVGSPGTFGDSGQVSLIGGLQGELLDAWHGAPYDRFGTAVDRIGDVDADGVSDFAAGATQAPLGWTGYARVVSLLSGAPLFDVSGEELGDEFGNHLSGVGDVNGDGVPDFGVGAPHRDPGGLASAGQVKIFSGGGPGFVNYCTAGTSANGCQALISGSGIPSATAPSGFTLSASNVEGNNAGRFIFSSNGRQANPWGNGTSFQCVVTPVKRSEVILATGTSGACDGLAVRDMNALWQAKPAKNPGAGAVVQAQFWYRDPANTSNQSSSLTNAIEFVVSQ